MKKVIAIVLGLALAISTIGCKGVEVTSTGTDITVKVKEVLEAPADAPVEVQGELAK